MLHSFLTKAAVSLIYRKSHAENHTQKIFSLLCAAERQGIEYLLSWATPKSYLSSSLLCLCSSCHRSPHAQVTLWWTMSSQPLSKWHSNPKRRPDLTISGIQNFLVSWASHCQNSSRFLFSIRFRMSSNKWLVLSIITDAVTRYCLVMSYFFLTGEPESQFWPSLCHSYVSKKCTGLDVVCFFVFLGVIWLVFCIFLSKS